MTGVPRGLGLVAALAVSGTALYLVYGANKKKAVLNVRRGKGTWRVEYLEGGSAMKQQQQAGSMQECGVTVELPEGKDIAIREIEWQQFRQQPPLPLLPTAGPAGELRSNGSREEALEGRLANCDADVAQVNALQDLLSSYGTEERQQQRSDGHEINFSTFVSPPAGVSEAQIRLNGRSQEPSSASCSSEAFLSSVASPVSSSKSPDLVGCFIIPGLECLRFSGIRNRFRNPPGSRKTAGKPKKVVRFSPSVAEPSSNNQYYRSRPKSVIAERAALQVNQRTHVPSSNITIRAAYERPKSYLQVPKGPVTYSVQRYRARTYY